MKGRGKGLFAAAVPGEIFLYIPCQIQLQVAFGFPNAYMDSIPMFLLGRPMLLTPLACFLFTFESSQELLVHP